MKKTFPILLTCIMSVGVISCSIGSAILAANERKANSKLIQTYDNKNKFFDDNAFFHDQGGEYISSYEPKKNEDVTVKLKVRRGYATEAKVAYTFDYNKANPVYHYNDMVFEKSDDGLFYDYWVGIIPANEAPYKYHFEIKNNVDSVYYNIDGVFEGTATSSGSDWSIRPEFSTPKWSQGATWYSIMPESYYNGNLLNDKTGAEWDTVWGGHNSWAGEWYGGDLEGITHKEDYLYNVLNVTSIFLNPIWVTAHNAGYGCYDFLQIDSALGNDIDLLNLVSSLHEDELKIMLDAVFQYCNVNNILNNVSSMYPDLIGDLYYNFHQRDENGEKLESVWSGSIIDFSYEITRKTLYTEEQSVMLAYIIFFGIDAWRMDVGNTLTGTRKENWETSTQILQDIRPYLKEVSEDVLFLSEHADDNQLTDGILDSKWNYAFNKALLDWCQGNSNASILSNGLRKACFYYPRGITNSLYNFLTTHDTEYFYDLINGDKTSFMSAQMLMMTYPGSPCIYFGEETGVKSSKLTDSKKMTNSFYTSMNWDESTYDHDIFNFTCSLTKLRKEYSKEFTNGGFMTLINNYLGNENDIFAYARFNETSVISVVNRNNFFINDFVLDVTKLGYADGTKLYDYVTGQEYIVSEGKVTINIAAFGSILTPKPNSNFVGTLSLDKIDEQTNIIKTNIDCFELSGKASDTSNFAYYNGYNNCSITLKAKEVKGAVRLIIKDPTFDLTFGAEISENSVSLIGDSAINKTINPNDTITLTRDNDNVCYISVNGSCMENSKRIVDFSENIKLGISNVDLQNKVELHFEKLANQVGTDFNESLGSMFTKGDNTEVKFENNGVEISNGYIVSNSHYGDFTFTANIQALTIDNNEYAGIFVGEDISNCFFFGFKASTNCIVAGKIMGHDVISYFVEDVENGSYSLQIEKTGTTFRFINKTTGQYLGSLNGNFSVLYSGAINRSSGFLHLDSARYGDSIIARDYSYLGKINFDSQDYIDSSLSISYSIINGVGFEYTNGGITETSNDEISEYKFGNSLKDYTATFSLRGIAAKDNDSYYGVKFDTDVNGNGGYLMKINNKGAISLLNSAGSVIDSNQIQDYKDTVLYQYHLEVIGNSIHIYDSNKSCILSSLSRTQVRGYMSYVSSYYSYELRSYNTYKQTGNIIQYEGSMYSTNKNNDYSLELDSSNSVNYAGLRNCGYNNITLGFNLQLTRISPIKRGYFDVNIGATVGSYYLDNLVVRFDDLGRLFVMENGETVYSNENTGIANVSSVYLVITYQDGKLNIKGVNYGSSEYFDILTDFKTNNLYRGTLSFYSSNAMVKMNHINGYSITESEDYRAYDSYTNVKLEEPIPPNAEPVNEPLTENYVNTFDSNSSLTTLDRYSGQVYIDEGNIVVNGYTTTNWDAGAAVAIGTVTNFELETRFKIGDVSASGGFVGIEFYKSSTSVNHQGSALTLVCYPSGWCGLFCGNGILTDYGVNCSIDSDGYITIHLKVNNGVIEFNGGLDTISVNISSLPYNNDLNHGFISINAGAAIGFFDYLKITIL